MGIPGLPDYWIPIPARRDYGLPAGEIRNPQSALRLRSLRQAQGLRQGKQSAIGSLPGACGGAIIRTVGFSGSTEGKGGKMAAGQELAD